MNKIMKKTAFFENISVCIYIQLCNNLLNCLGLMRVSFRKISFFPRLSEKVNTLLLI